MVTDTDTHIMDGDTVRDTITDIITVIGMDTTMADMEIHPITITTVTTTTEPTHTAHALPLVLATGQVEAETEHLDLTIILELLETPIQALVKDTKEQ